MLLTATRMAEQLPAMAQLSWTSVVLAVLAVVTLWVTWRARSSGKRVDDIPRVAIIGGSFAGSHISRHLLILNHVFDPNAAEYTPGILRAYVDPQHLKSVSSGELSGFGPLSSFVRAKVEKISIGNVQHRISFRINDGALHEQDFDAVVVATGSAYTLAKQAVAVPAPAKDSRRKQLDSIATAISTSDSIVLVGGGPVGVELAGEIVHTYGRSKTVTVINAAAGLLDGLHPALGQAAGNWLQDRGVTIVLKDKLSPVDMPVGMPSRVPGRTVTTVGGVCLPAELVITCVGIKHNTEWIQQQGSKSDGATPGSAEASSESPAPSLASSLDSRGRIVVNSAFEARGLEGRGVFALGDVAAHPSAEPYLAHTAEKQAEIVAANVERYLHWLDGRPEHEAAGANRTSSGWGPGAVGPAASPAGLRSTPDSSEPRLLQYPEDFSGPGYGTSPVIVCVSLGPHHGLLDFNGRVVLTDRYVGQRLAGLMKQLIEVTKVDQMRGGAFGTLFWRCADLAAVWTSRWLLPRLPPVPAATAPAKQR